MYEVTKRDIVTEAATRPMPIARRLDRYPNFHVDTAERLGDLSNQPSDKVREFFIRHQDRILYGTDVIIEQSSGNTSEEQQQNEKTDYEERIGDDWQYLTGDEVIDATLGNLLNPFKCKL